MICRASLFEYANHSSKKGDSSIFDSYAISSHDLWVYFIASALGKIAIISDELAFYRQHDSNVAGADKTRALKELINISLTTGWQPYFFRATESRHRIDALNAIKFSSLDMIIKARADRAQRIWSRIAIANERRAMLYRDLNKISKLCTLIALILTVSYRSFERGGFGLRGLAKDCTLGLFWQRSNSGESNIKAKNMDDSS
jgi:hypothetical protein